MFQTFKPYVTLTGDAETTKNVQGIIDRNTKILRGVREREIDGQTVSEPGQFCRNVREGRWDGAMVGRGEEGEHPEYERGASWVRSWRIERWWFFVVKGLRREGRGVFSSSRLQRVGLPDCQTAWSWESGAGVRS